MNTTALLRRHDNNSSDDDMHLLTALDVVVPQAHISLALGKNAQVTQQVTRTAAAAAAATPASFPHDSSSFSYDDDDVSAKFVDTQFAHVLSGVIRENISLCTALAQLEATCRAAARKAKGHHASKRTFDEEAASWALMWHLFLDDPQVLWPVGEACAPSAMPTPRLKRAHALVAQPETDVNRAARIVTWLEELARRRLDGGAGGEDDDGGGGGGGENEDGAAAAEMLLRYAPREAVPRFAVRSGASAGGADPDACARMGTQLPPTDAASEARVLRGAWTLRRCARHAEAARLLRHAGCAWRVAALRHPGAPHGWHPLTRLGVLEEESACENHEVVVRFDVPCAPSTAEPEESELPPAEALTAAAEALRTELEWGDPEKPHRVHRFACLHAAKSATSTHEASMLGISCGSARHALLACETWEDALWAMLRCWLVTRLDEKLGAETDTARQRTYNSVEDVNDGGTGDDGDDDGTQLTLPYVDPGEADGSDDDDFGDDVVMEHTSLSMEWPPSADGDYIAPPSLTACVEALVDGTSEMGASVCDRAKAECHMPHRKVQACLATKQYSTLLKHMRAWTNEDLTSEMDGDGDGDMAQGQSGPDNAMLRFAAHLLIILNWLVPDGGWVDSTPEEEGAMKSPPLPAAVSAVAEYSALGQALNASVNAYVYALAAKRRWELAPLYLSFLRRPLLENTCAQLMDALLDITVASETLDVRQAEEARAAFWAACVSHIGINESLHGALKCCNDSLNALKMMHAPASWMSNDAAASPSEMIAHHLTEYNFNLFDVRHAVRTVSWLFRERSAWVLGTFRLVEMLQLLATSWRHDGASVADRELLGERLDACFPESALHNATSSVGDHADASLFAQTPGGSEARAIAEALLHLFSVDLRGRRHDATVDDRVSPEERVLELRSLALDLGKALGEMRGALEAFTSSDSAVSAGPAYIRVLATATGGADGASVSAEHAGIVAAAVRRDLASRVSSLGANVAVDVQTVTSPTVEGGAPMAGVVITLAANQPNAEARAGDIASAVADILKGGATACPSTSEIGLGSWRVHRLDGCMPSLCHLAANMVVPMAIMSASARSARLAVDVADRLRAVSWEDDILLAPSLAAPWLDLFTSEEKLMLLAWEANAEACLAAAAEM